MNFRRGRGRDEPEINLIPLIDILIVVLIFLFLTTTYSRYSELQINLPTAGAGNPAQLAHGISVALYNTLFGIGVSIPAVIFYRHFRNRVDVLVVEMESQAIKLIEILHGERRA
ncbi:MAG TPA: MotA/TolQ/ExbB proton channel family protein [Usitatibacter sp.]|nr:MotA/TolQ/ExbB proton channel family protein [Usitatibacter sp.]